MSPSGTSRPSALNTSRPVNQHAAENAVHAPMPSDALEARAHGCSTLPSSLSGVALDVPSPTVITRIRPYAGSFAASSSAVALNPCTTVNCWLLCPPHSSTSPNSTSDRVAAPPAVEANVKLNGPPAACGGRRARHTPSPPAVALMGAPPSPLTVTVAPGASTPHRSAPAPPRCSTAPSEKTFDTRRAAAVGSASAAAATAAASARAVRRFMRANTRCSLFFFYVPCDSGALSQGSTALDSGVGRNLARP